MTPIDVRLGTGGDVDDAALVYELSNLVRRQGRWPSRAARVAQITASLHDAAGHDTASWFLIGREGSEAVAMALVHPFRADGGSGDVIAGTWFLSLIYVLPERWGQGIVGIGPRHFAQLAVWLGYGELLSIPWLVGRRLEQGRSTTAEVTLFRSTFRDDEQ